MISPDSVPTEASFDPTAANVKAELDRLRVELGQRDTYIHELHLAREADQRRANRLHRDLEEFIFSLRDAEDERAALKARLTALESRPPKNFGTWLQSLLGKKPKRPTPASVPAFVDYPDAPFVYHLKNSPFRVHREPTFTLHGWAFPRDGRPVTALRARLDDRCFSGTYGLDEREVIRHYGPQEHNPKPGFKIVVETPGGRHRLSLEARLAGDDWVSIFKLPIWVKPGP